MDKIDLDELERLAKAATPGPWIIADSDCCIDIFTEDEYVGNVAKPEDAAYIAAACDAVPELIARVRELERQRSYLAKNAAYGCHAYDRYATFPNVGDCQDCPIRNNRRCRDATQNDWIDAAERLATKEAGE